MQLASDHSFQTFDLFLPVEDPRLNCYLDISRYIDIYIHPSGANACSTALISGSGGLLRLVESLDVPGSATQAITWIGLYVSGHYM